MNTGNLGPSGYGDAMREARLLALMGGGTHIPNCYLDFAISGGALTISLLAATGQSASPSDPIFAPFHDATESVGKPVIRRVTTRLRLTIPSTAMMGFTSAVAARLWFVLFDDVGSGQQRLGVINCLSGTNIFPLGAWPIASTTAMSTAADNAHVFFTDVALTSMPYVILGSASWENGLSVAGTWDAKPSRPRMYGHGVPLPGDVIQEQVNFDGAVATGTTLIPGDDTIPQNTEGDQYMTQTITPVSSANILDIDAELFLSNATRNQMTIALFQDSGADAIAVMPGIISSAGDSSGMPLYFRKRAGTTSPITFKIRAGVNNSGTTTFNGVAGSRKYGGALASFLGAAEKMA